MILHLVSLSVIFVCLLFIASHISYICFFLCLFSCKVSENFINLHNRDINVRDGCQHISPPPSRRPHQREVAEVGMWRLGRGVWGDVGI